MLKAVVVISFYSIARKNIMSGFRISEPQSRTKVFGLRPTSQSQFQSGLLLLPPSTFCLFYPMTKSHQEVIDVE